MTADMSEGRCPIPQQKSHADHMCSNLSTAPWYAEDDEQSCNAGASSSDSAMDYDTVERVLSGPGACLQQGVCSAAAALDFEGKHSPAGAPKQGLCQAMEWRARQARIVHCLHLFGQQYPLRVIPHLPLTALVLGGQIRDECFISGRTKAKGPCRRWFHPSPGDAAPGTGQERVQRWSAGALAVPAWPGPSAAASRHVGPARPHTPPSSPSPAVKRVKSSVAVGQFECYSSASTPCLPQRQGGRCAEQVGKVFVCKRELQHISWPAAQILVAYCFSQPVCRHQANAGSAAGSMDSVRIAHLQQCSLASCTLAPIHPYCPNAHCR